MSEKMKRRLEIGQMPNKTTYTIWLVVGFLMGILWGVLAVFPFMKMRKAIDANDLIEAWVNADKVQGFVIVGMVISFIAAVFRMLYSY